MSEEKQSAVLEHWLVAVNVERGRARFWRNTGRLLLVLCTIIPPIVSLIWPLRGEPTMLAALFVLALVSFVAMGSLRNQMAGAGFQMGRARKPAPNSLEEVLWLPVSETPHIRGSDTESEARRFLFAAESVSRAGRKVAVAFFWSVAAAALARAAVSFAFWVLLWLPFAVLVVIPVAQAVLLAEQVAFRALESELQDRVQLASELGYLSEAQRRRIRDVVKRLATPDPDVFGGDISDG